MTQILILPADVAVYESDPRYSFFKPSSSLVYILDLDEVVIRPQKNFRHASGSWGPSSSQY